MSSVIGEAFVAVHMTADEAELRRATAAATRPALAQVEKEAAVTGERAGKTLGGHFAGGLKTIGIGATLSGLAAVGAVVHTGISETEDYQRGLAQLEQGIKTTGAAAGVTAPQMEALASQIQSYSGQTDDSIVATEQLLLRFSNLRNEAGAGNDVFTQTTKIAADMAARLGGDASSQATKLGRALNDPVKGMSALTRVGVTFTAQQQAQIQKLVASGHTLQAQKVILAQLQHEYGGSAKAVGQTLPGQIERGKRSFEDLSQSIITHVLPGLIDTATFIARNSSVILPLAGAVIVLVGAYKTYTLVTKIATVAQQLLNAEMELNPIGLVVAALAALALGLIYAYHKSETFRNIVNGAMHGAAAAISFVVDTGRKVLSWFENNWEYVLAGVIGGPFGLAVVYIAKHFDQIVGFVHGLPGRIGRAAVGMWDGIKNSFRDAINWVIDKLNWVIGQFHITLPRVNTHIPGVGTIGGTRIGASNSAIPHLASGGSVGAGLAVVGENGPEIVSFHRPATVYGAGASRHGLGGDRLVALLEELNDHLVGLRNDVRTTIGPQVGGALNGVAAGADLAAASAVGGW